MSGIILAMFAVATVLLVAYWIGYECGKGDVVNRIDQTRVSVRESYAISNSAGRNAATYELAKLWEDYL